MSHEQQDMRSSHPRMVSVDEDDIFDKIDFFIFDDLEFDILVGTHKNDAFFMAMVGITFFGREGTIISI